MAIQLTQEEMRLVKEGKLDPLRIEEYRQENPVKEASVDLNEVEQVKDDIRQANVHYKRSIERNKELYVELEENRKEKEKWRNTIAELRQKKKKLLGVE